MPQESLHVPTERRHVVQRVYNGKEVLPDPPTWRLRWWAA